MKFAMMAIDRNRQLEFFGFDRKSIKEEKACL